MEIITKTFSSKKRKTIVPTQKTYDDFLTSPIEQSFKFDLTSDKEIITYIKTLKNYKKNNEPFSISHKRFKKVKKPISTRLNLLINLTFSKKKFLDILKIGKNFPICRKNCKTDVNNYRPISYPI